MTSGDAKRSVTGRPRGTAMQRGTNMNCVAMIARRDPAVRPDRRPQIVFGELARQMQRLWVDALDVAGRVDVSGQRREHDHAERRGDEHADAKRPQQFGAENSLLVNFGWSVGHALAHRAARQEDQQIDRQIAKHQQRDRRAGQDGGAERRHAHHFGERSFIICQQTQTGDGRKKIGQLYSLAPPASDSQPAPLYACLKNQCHDTRGGVNKFKRTASVRGGWLSLDRRGQ